LTKERHAGGQLSQKIKSHSAKGEGRSAHGGKNPSGVWGRKNNGERGDLKLDHGIRLLSILGELWGVAKIKDDHKPEPVLRGGNQYGGGQGTWELVDGSKRWGGKVKQSRVLWE